VSVRVVSTIDDALKAAQAERDENTCRKDFAPSEAVAVGKTIEALELPRARENKQRGAAKARARKAGAVDVDKSTTSTRAPEASRTTNKAAKTVGISRIPYERVKAVVEAAQEDPETFQPLVDEMDRKGKVARVGATGRSGGAARRECRRTLGALAPNRRSTHPRRYCRLF
jgi:hypothetical protein